MATNHEGTGMDSHGQRHLDIVTDAWRKPGRMPEVCHEQGWSNPGRIDPPRRETDAPRVGPIQFERRDFRDRREKMNNRRSKKKKQGQVRSDNDASEVDILGHFGTIRKTV